MLPRLTTIEPGPWVAIMLLTAITILAALIVPNVGTCCFGGMGRDEARGSVDQSYSPDGVLLRMRPSRWLSTDYSS